ncbi:constitutive coactivator of peroxisome proliferator-activated receptor gamma isoform X2 [Sinocyclocheilus anshuiensis]|uniref:constitutive coactivator of peroxisome proliferator-activated receptor gamma isoform X1 n=1 Tax=Sinocyclocheilus anshuiensis TaxID=1608454 RepID=UPI0007B8EE31|nr:PREDICTED: constitutive coactivator of peroxisome proliferator-activated receptor gamma-like isoform X1 [Sinocyclocheilus anshuiensis]XP_016304985.1 PREDICTED: constitutive coactivator of peroxisome proliferator-activated receptor gamma-like isoform X2 [Sinocyclocheilus anshuiensis]
MGVKGLQYFMEACCPDTCVPVDLKQMAVDYVKAHPDSTATVVVDGMACLRYWYRCQAWVHGGQWQEYMHILQEFLDAFTAADIRLVFFFDGTVEEQKRAEWVKRRLRVNQDIARIFQHIKTHGQQPNSRDLFCLPSGLATFSRFALKSLGQESRCSVREGDYEISDYALSHNCMGILGQDTDFVIYNTVPYLSINKLNLNNMTTVLFSRERLCHVLKLHMTDLPLLACLLGNDVVPEQQMERLRNSALASYRMKHKQFQGDKVYAVADFISVHHPSSEGTFGVSSLSLVEAEKEALEKGIRLYLLTGQMSPWLESSRAFPESVCLMGNYVPGDILQAAMEKHTQAECFLVYNVLHDGVVECSNTLEDEDEVELPPQAILYLPVRERIYGLLLPVQPDCSGHTVSVKEWFAFPGNPLKEPNRVTPKPLNHLKGPPDLMALWFRTDPEVKAVQASTLLDVFDLYEFTEELKHFDSPLIAVICLVTYITVQARQLSLEDVDAYLSQAVCVRFKSFREMQQLRTPVVDPRAIQLGSLFVRGLTYLISANSACGFPFPMGELMPWRTFDGLLFHSKYLQAHSGCPKEELLEGNPSWMSLFLSVRELVLEACRRRGVPVHSRPRRLQRRDARPMEADDLLRERRPQLHHSARQEFRQQPRASAHYQQGYRPRHPKRGRYRLAPRWPQSQN